MKRRHPVVVWRRRLCEASDAGEQLARSSLALFYGGWRSSMGQRITDRVACFARVEGQGNVPGRAAER